MRYEEKSVLKRFVIFYFGVTLVLLGIIFILIYNFQLDTQRNLALAKMKNFSFRLSSNIIMSQMNNQNLNCESAINSNYRFMLLDKSGNRIAGDFVEKKGLYIEDKSPLGHLGVWSIVVEDRTFEDIKKAILKKTLLGFLLSYIVIAMLGYYLIRLFLKPIKDARDRLDNFIKDTTHELNTPITALLMCANESSLKNPKNIERVNLSAKRVSELYKDLTYIFLEDKSKKIEKFKIKDVVKELFAFYEPLALKKRITISCDLDDSEIKMDIEDFKRLFSNLLSNTIKYNKKGGSVDIKLNKAILIIEDSGIGIDKKDIDRIFDRYYRATKQDGGFGIGLSIVEHISKEYNINLKIDSIKGRGSTFRLDFSNLTT